ncbi:hypothetical protein ACQ4M4_09930 [Leptolyngbya sp. AN02str]|uniref:hypothetical protein n=1 Tax=Leptolyngbya sp. AN02str TaxID=3423363 RepID=UPI003D31D146
MAARQVQPPDDPAAHQPQNHASWKPTASNGLSTPLGRLLFERDCVKEAAISQDINLFSQVGL